MDILSLFCDLDDFCRCFEPAWLHHQKALAPKRRRASILALSEVLTLLVLFHASDYRTFKHFYLQHVRRFLRQEFPDLVSYTRFIELIPAALVPLCAYLRTRLAEPTGIAFIDSTSIAVCHNRRIHSHKVFAGVAQRGKTSVGWFFGFKLHLVINDRGELLACCLTPGNVDDRTPLGKLVQDLWGKLFGDKGYISQEWFEELWAEGVQLITKLKKTMKNKLMPWLDKLLLRKRALIESVHDQLKNISQLEHTRHRSVVNGFVNMIAALAARFQNNIAIERFVV